MACSGSSPARETKLVDTASEREERSVCVCGVVTLCVRFVCVCVCVCVLYVHDMIPDLTSLTL